MNEVKNEVLVVRSPSRWPNERKWDYEAHCLRCGSQIHGSRTSTWATKAPAAKKGKEHLERHATTDRWLTQYLSSHYELVETVEAE